MSPPSGVIPSPNIWRRPDLYELENRRLDAEGRIWEAILSVADWAGRDVLDLGCGSGFHLTRFAAGARRVVGVEPHPPLVESARRRTAGHANVRVLPGTAQALPVADASIDLAHARLAYFFGPGCEPGLVELDRVLRRGGTAVVVDNDASRSTFGTWFRAGFPRVDPAAVQRFWATRGWNRLPLMLDLRCETRAEFETLIRLELPPHVAGPALAAYPGTAVDYAVDLWWKGFGPT